jgi:S1-C subfamily serine protease
MFTLIRSIFILIIGIVGSIFVISNNPSLEEVPSNIVSQLPLAETITSTSTPNQTEISPKVPKNITRDRDIEEPKIITDVKPQIPEIVDVTTKLMDIIVIPQAKETILSTSNLNTTTREALVNILCTTKTSGLINPITGSGIIIDKRGVILTNAHIAQYYLLENYSTEDFLTCAIRTGSPAVNTYKAELLFISSSWINDNYQKIVQSNPTGTGENDFALLLITEMTKPGTSLPNVFPFISPETREQEPQPIDSVVVAGYPAGFLGGTSIQKELYAVSTVTQVGEVFTFKESTVDLFSIGGNIAAQKGSSGGGIVSLSGRLLGIVVTATDALQTDDRDLRAITLSHINRSLKEEVGSDLNGYLFGDLAGKSIQFRNLIAPVLTDLLESALGN